MPPGFATTVKVAVCATAAVGVKRTSKVQLSPAASGRGVVLSASTQPFRLTGMSNPPADTEGTTPPGAGCTGGVADGEGPADRRATDHHVAEALAGRADRDCGGSGDRGRQRHGGDVGLGGPGDGVAAGGGEGPGLGAGRCVGTRRTVMVHEAPLTGGASAQVSWTIERSSPVRVTATDVMFCGPLLLSVKVWWHRHADRHRAEVVRRRRHHQRPGRGARSAPTRS